jgi:hypothetical protein
MLYIGKGLNEKARFFLGAKEGEKINEKTRFNELKKETLTLWKSIHVSRMKSRNLF